MVHIWILDFNGDGWLDLFISQISGPYCYILWGGPEGKSRLIENGQDITFLGISGGFIQYRLILGAKCGCGTPRVSSVTIEFDEDEYLIITGRHSYVVH